MKGEWNMDGDAITTSSFSGGVTPVNEITFGINPNGRTGTESIIVKDAESLAISINGQIEEWDSMDAEGWKRRLMTGKSISISMGGKRNYGDPGNDYVAGLFRKKGQACNSIMTITFPDGDKFVMPCVVNVTSIGGNATSVGELQWEALSDGKPEYIPAA